MRVTFQSKQQSLAGRGFVALGVASAGDGADDGLPTLRQVALRAGVAVAVPGAVIDGRLEAELSIGGAAVGFTIDGVDDGDDLTVAQVSATELSISVIHRVKKDYLADAEACLVTCADGSQGSPCVTCESGGLTARICC